MPQRSKGVRLWLRRERGRDSVWVIRHGDRQVRTGCLERHKAAAQTALEQYRIKISEGQPSAPEAVIYFVSSDALPDFPIKIGIALQRLRSRLAALQSASPWPLVVLATIPGNIEDEARFHRQFKADWIRGEWFRRTPELLGLIGRIAHLRADAA